jgi:hypothetical protein
MRGLKRMLMNRCRLLLFAPFLVAVTALGINVTCAGANDSGKGQPKNSHDYYKIRDPKVDPKLSAEKRARVQRDDVFKKRQDARKFIQNVMAGDQGAPSDKKEGGGAK